MDDKKNEHEKLIKYIMGKLKDGELILMIESILIHGKLTPSQAKLVITSSCLYFLQSTSIKKYFKASCIQFIVLTPRSNQIVIFYNTKGDDTSKQYVRLESRGNVKIVQHIILVREKFNEMRVKLTVMICITKTLESVVSMHEQSGRSRILGFLFKKKETPVEIQQRISGQAEVLEVSSNNFALEIGSKMYELTYVNVRLLYINSIEAFTFKQEQYLREQLTPVKKLFTLKPTNQQQSSGAIKLNAGFSPKMILMRKIAKTSPELDFKLEQHLKNYLNSEYKEELLYALETETHFEVLTSMEEGEKNCQQLLHQHEHLSEKDLRSIFFKLVEMIESTHEVFCSLSPENITISSEGIKISEIFSCLERRLELDYTAPEELTSQAFTHDQIELINLWKAGILIFELAYGNVPFPIEHLIDKIAQSEGEVYIQFPEYSLRTQEFQLFLKSILRMDPNSRGTCKQNNRDGGTKSASWKDRVMMNSWLKYR